MNIEMLKMKFHEGKSLPTIAEEMHVTYGKVKYELHRMGLRKWSRNAHLKGDQVLCVICGDDDPKNFYPSFKQTCKECHNDNSLARKRRKREYALNKLGGKCIHCGFDEFPCSLDIHHVDPTKKDSDFKGMRGWSYARIDKEIENCVLLCKNHHQALHSNLIELKS